MKAATTWVGAVHQNLKLGERVIRPPKPEIFRQMIDRSRLLDRANDFCTALNARACEALIYQEVFTDELPGIGRFIIEEENIDLIMELTIFPNGPAVVFSSKKSRPWVKRIQRYCGRYFEAKSDIVCVLRINPATVTDAEIHRWFTYLISGLHPSLKPQPAKASV